MSVYLTQLLCPSRHCVVALAWDDAEFTRRKAKATLRDGMTQAGARWACGLCKSTILKFDTRRTPWKSLEEATPVLKASEMDQALTREWYAKRH